MIPYRLGTIGLQYSMKVEVCFLLSHLNNSISQKHRALDEKQNKRFFLYITIKKKEIEKFKCHFDTRILL